MTIYNETYSSLLGRFELKIDAIDKSFHEEQEAVNLLTTSHAIAIVRRYPPQEWLLEQLKVERAIAWQFYITKRSPNPEPLVFSMELLPDGSQVEIGPDTGQYLLAVEFENGTRQLHLGTEDEDSMAERASQNDGMPTRFGTLLKKSVLQPTAIHQRGLQTTIPALEQDEQFYFHYVIAENPLRKSADYPDEPDISTWCAVSQTKGNLERGW